MTGPNPLRQSVIDYEAIGVDPEQGEHVRALITQVALDADDEALLVDAILGAPGKCKPPRGFRGAQTAGPRPAPPSAPKPPRKRAQCGTPQAYRRHLANAEQPCQPCRDAIAAVRREARATQKERGQR